MRKYLLYSKVILRRYSNPVFLVLLVLSFFMWYVKKLSYDTQAEITIPVKVDDHYYNALCTVQGVGYDIFLHKLTPRKNTISLSSDHLALTPSAISPGDFEIPTFELQNMISRRVSNLRVVSVDHPVEIEGRKAQRNIERVDKMEQKAEMDSVNE